MNKAIYLLCGLTSLACAILLVRRYFYVKGRLLLFSSLFFISQAVANVLLYVDLVVIPDQNLMPLRLGVTVAGLIILVYGLIWETT